MAALMLCVWHPDAVDYAVDDAVDHFRHRAGTGACPYRVFDVRGWVFLLALNVR